MNSACIRQQLITPAAVARIRKRVAELVGTFERTVVAELHEREQRLEGTEIKSRRLIGRIADGLDSDYVRQEVMDLEAQARMERAAVDALRPEAAIPVGLPSPEEIVTGALDLETVLTGPPLKAREALRALFKDGRVVMHPQPDSTFVAEASLYPLVAMSEMTKPLREEGPRRTALSCAGANRAQFTAISLSFERRIAA